MVSPEEDPSTDSDSSCDDIILLDEIIKTSEDGKKKKKRKRRRRNKKMKLDMIGAPDTGFIVLDSVGSSDKEEGEVEPTNDVEDGKEKDVVDAEGDTVTPLRRKNSLVSALFDTPQNVNCDDLFQIDTTPSTKDFVAIPKYQSNYDANEAITGSEIKKEEEKKPRPRGVAMCWNCGTEGHQIRDCKQRRNPMMINKFRMEAQAKRAFRQMQSRYHEDEGTQYGAPIPGMPSEKLREALGLADNQLPEYVYRMRVLGYPPGWMEEAKVHHSGINMFDSNGEAVQDPNDEEGEIVSQGERDRFDLNKLVEFPGFNVPPPKNTEDQTDFYDVPIISKEQSLESLIAKLKPKAVKAYRKRKLAMMESAMDSDEEYNCDYMETEEILDSEELPPDSCKFTPCPPPEEPPAPPPPPNDTESEKEEGEEEETELAETEKANHKSNSSSRSQSPSLTQLEKYKTELLSQLNTTSTTGAHRTPVASLGKIKSMEQGTPVLKLSPYQQLPKFENFQKNVSDVINFENLPDSTGKYDKLIPLIHKVKKVMSKINESS